ncbi:MAG TPA: hypothetical protein VFA80_10390 [Xanthobacteraceae bacterium]|nr:hypothetical protein [Xanthobacteraceae bacterium]
MANDPIARRKEIYESLHPETKNGGDRGNQHTGGKAVRQNGDLPDRFTKDAAAKIGMSWARAAWPDFSKRDRFAGLGATFDFVTHLGCGGRRGELVKNARPQIYTKCKFVTERLGDAHDLDGRSMTHLELGLDP